MYSTVRGLGVLAISLLIPVLTLVANDRIAVPVPNNLTAAALLPPVHRLQTYLQIRTDHGDTPPDYRGAVAFLNRTVSELLPQARFTAREFVPGKPVVLVTLPGDDALPALLLNSHTDVVPAEPDKWQWPPFDARLVFVGAQWRLYARGAQDMKSVGMQYLEALSALYATGWRPQRTIVVSFVPDEEIGGRDGMQSFIRSRLFRSLNIGVALDEGTPNPGAAYNVYCGERQTWWLAVKVEGDPGHGASFPVDTAAQVLQGIVGRVLNFRSEQLAKKTENDLNTGEVIGINLVYMKAGQPDEDMVTGHIMNMVPTVAEAGFDIRVPPDVDPKVMERVVESWMRCRNGRTCPGTTYKWVMKVQIRTTTSCDPAENPYYADFKKGLQVAGIADNLAVGTLAGATDARYLREANIPAFGFSPITETRPLLHQHDEYISVNGYMKGCEIYKHVIRQMAGPSIATVNSTIDLDMSVRRSPQIRNSPRGCDTIDGLSICEEQKERL